MPRCLIILAWLMLSFMFLQPAEQGSAQTATGRSKKGTISLKPAVPAPSEPVKNSQSGVRLPDLLATVNFSEPSGNKFLDAGEAGKLTVVVTNQGEAIAYDLETIASLEIQALELSIVPARVIDSLRPGESSTVEVGLLAAENTKSKEIKLRLEVRERKGFDLDPPVLVTFSTRQLQPPQLIVADIGINDFNKNGKIEPREVVEVTARIQNVGEATARNVSLSIGLGENVFLGEDSKTSFYVGDLLRGDYKDVVFSLYTNTRASGVPITYSFQESQQVVDTTVNLAFNKPQKTPNQLLVEGVDQTPEGIVDVATLSVDVDVSVPRGQGVNPNAIAIILGVEQYRRLPEVTYAKRDAAVFRDYSISFLGVPDDKNHLYFKTDDEVTRGEFDKLFAEDGWLANRIDETSDVFIYYAGHGAPDVGDHTPYLIPYDGDANYPKQTGYNLVQFYDRLSKLNVRSLTVFIDACFSGGTRENKVLLADARPIGVVIDNPIIVSEKVVAFTASLGNQISSSYPDKKHGLFTYFLLKGMQGPADRDGDSFITVEELGEFLVSNVEKTARRLDREQKPQILGTDRQRVLGKLVQ